MAVYFDYKIKRKDEGITFTHLAWHKNFPLLAATLHNEDQNVDAVHFYLDEGEEVPNSQISKSACVSELCWHPTRKVVASGWSNGELATWNEHEKETHEAPTIHQCKITCLQWNGTGSRLISTDEGGLLCVWKVDQRGRLQQAPMFKHDVGSSINSVAFKLLIGADIAADIAAAARAAVSGDETALDLFEFQKPGQPKFSMSQAESIQLYFGLKDGSVYFLDDRGKCSKCFQVEGAVKYLVYYQTNDIVLTISEALLLTQHVLKQENEYTETHKVKLSGKAVNFSIAWAGNGLLATSCKERVARVLDIDNDQNFVLNLDGNTDFSHDECITSIAYSQQKGILAGGTNKGHVAMWKYNILQSDEQPWELQPPSSIEGEAESLKWGSSNGLLAVNCSSTITILSQSIMNSCFSEKVAAIQVNPNQLSVETFPSGQVHDIKTDVHIKGVSCTKTHTVIWNGKKVAVYEVSENKSMVRAAGTFNSDSQKIGIHEQNIYLLEAEKMTVRTFQGTTKQELNFLEQEGDPIEFNLFKTFLCVGTTKAVLKVYDLSRREARQVGITKHLEDVIPSFNTFQSLKCNCTGTKVAFTPKTGDHIVSSYLYIWDVETDTIQCFNFATGKSNHELEDDLAVTQNQLTSAIKGFSPKSIFWDSNDPKLLVCEAVKVASDKTGKKIQFGNKPTEATYSTDDSLVVVTMFSTPDHGLIVQDHFHPEQSVYSVLLGIDVPHFYFVKSTSKEIESYSKKKHVIQKTFRDFVGLEDADDSVRQAMSNFSYLSAIGNMDEAFKAIKTIKSGSVWENMARMCVKTKRLDVAMVCLGNMGNAGAAKAVRECKQSEPEPNVHVAMLAINIGMNEEAERLYKECGRYDLLNQFYQASDHWKKAIECAENHDRIHLRTTYYNYGKYLESYGNIQAAIQQYERSETNKFEVPRMLFDDQEKLEAYIAKQKDSHLSKWWAQYNESIGEMDTALQYYEIAKEYLSMVRVLCYCDKVERAADLCNEVGDKAACYHLARQYDSNGDVKNAIHYFSRAHSYSNAIRLAKENELDHELVGLALLSTQENMLDCARYFEFKEEMADKAVLLYHKAGSVSKAIDLAFKTEQFGALQLISEDLDENADPEILKKCAEFFINHDQFDRAVNLLVVAKRFEDAITMCNNHHITLTEDLAEKMTPSKGDEGVTTQDRNLLLEKIGECAYKQGSLHLATKKFTQAGNRIKAMKSLLKSGDTEKITFFAGVSRQKEIYVMAANYLQSLDWRRDPEIMKNIISFYTKGRSLESLSSFYDACAQVEIDEFQNYEKAFGALSEAYKSLSKAKSKNPTQQEERLVSIKARLTQMKIFIQARKSYGAHPAESLQECEQLITETDLSSSVRVGDVYAFIIQHYYANQNYNQSYQTIEDMYDRYPKLKIQNFLSMSIVEHIHQQVGVPIRDHGKNGISNGNMESDGEEMDEEIEEDDTDDFI